MSNSMKHAMRRLARLPLLAALLSASLLAQAQDDDRPAIVHTGAKGYAIIDGTTYPSGAYLGLACEQSACRLVPAQVSLEDRRLDLRDGPETHPFLQSDLKTRALFLVRGIPGLAAGPVKTWYVNERFLAAADPSSLAPARRRLEKNVLVDGAVLNFGGHWLEGVQPDCSGDGCAARLLAWKLRFGPTERTLAALWPSAIVGEDGMLGVDDVLVWVGDLDGDGKPDLVIRPQSRPDYLTLSLFLSTQLRVGQPWREAAKFYYWDPENPGC